MELSLVKEELLDGKLLIEKGLVQHSFVNGMEMKWRLRCYLLIALHMVEKMIAQAIS